MEWLHVASLPVNQASSVLPENVFFPVCYLSEVKPPTSSKDTQDLEDLTVLKSLADSPKPKEGTELPLKKEEEQYVPDESDSTKSRRLVEDYDSTKNGMDDGKYRGCARLLYLERDPRRRVPPAGGTRFKIGEDT